MHGDLERAKEMIASLPSLPVGVAWFWSPGWGDIFTRVKIRARQTFDSSATPEVGKITRRPSVTAPVDIEKLGGQIQAAVRKAKENDPLALRRRITELERQIHQKTGAGEENALRKAVQKALEERERQHAEVEELKKAVSALQVLWRIRPPEGWRAEQPSKP